MRKSHLLSIDKKTRGQRIGHLSKRLTAQLLKVGTGGTLTHFDIIKEAVKWLSLEQIQSLMPARVLRDNF